MHLQFPILLVSLWKRYVLFNFSDQMSVTLSEEELPPAVTMYVTKAFVIRFCAVPCLC